MLYLFILENSTNFYWIPEPTQSFYLHGKENSSKFWSFLQGSSTFFDNAYLGSRWLVIILENSYKQIKYLVYNNLFTINFSNIWVNRN